MGVQLGNLIVTELESRDLTEEERLDLVDRLANEAGISESTMGQIIRGEIECPPFERLQGISEVLSISLESLVSAGEGDGCNYDTTENKLLDKMAYIRNKFKV